MNKKYFYSNVLKNIKIKSAVALVFAFSSIFSCKIIAQSNNAYEKKPWLISFGVNSIFEDRDQFVRYVNNESILWNISPITFGVEKRVNYFIGLSGIIGSNQYPENQRINGSSIEQVKDIIFIDLNTKFNLVPLLEYKTFFDPYFVAGVGYLNRSVNNEIAINLGFGFNYWLNKNYAFNVGGSYKFNRGIESEVKEGDFLQLNLMLIQVIN